MWNDGVFEVVRPCGSSRQCHDAQASHVSSAGGFRARKEVMLGREGDKGVDMGRL